MRKFRVVVDGNEYIVDIEEIENNEDKSNNISEKKLSRKNNSVSTKKSRKKAKKKELNTSGSSDITAPMPGKILEIKASEGDKIEKGELLIVLEAMKLENNITAPLSGIVEEILVKQGANVESGELLLKMK